MLAAAGGRAGARAAGAAARAGECCAARARKRGARDVFAASRPGSRRRPARGAAGRLFAGASQQLRARGAGRGARRRAAGAAAGVAAAAGARARRAVRRAVAANVLRRQLAQVLGRRAGRAAHLERRADGGRRGAGGAAAAAAHARRANWRDAPSECRGHRRLVCRCRILQRRGARHVRQRALHQRLRKQRHRCLPLRSHACRRAAAHP